MLRVVNLSCAARDKKENVPAGFVAIPRLAVQRHIVRRDFFGPGIAWALPFVPRSFAACHRKQLGVEAGLAHCCWEVMRCSNVLESCTDPATRRVMHPTKYTSCTPQVCVVVPQAPSGALHLSINCVYSSSVLFNGSSSTPALNAISSGFDLCRGERRALLGRGAAVPEAVAATPPRLWSP
jgi:hypothetical protein